MSALAQGQRCGRGAGVEPRLPGPLAHELKADRARDRRGREAGLDDGQASAFGHRIEADLDARREGAQRIVRVVGPLPAEGDPLELLDRLDDAPPLAAVLPAEDDVAAWAQVDLDLRGQPLAQVLRLGDDRPRLL